MRYPIPPDLDAKDPYVAPDGSREPYWKKDVSPYQQLYATWQAASFSSLLGYFLWSGAVDKYFIVGLLLLVYFFILVFFGLHVFSRRLKWRRENLPWYRYSEPYSHDSIFSGKNQIIIGSSVLIIMTWFGFKMMTDPSISVNALTLCIQMLITPIALFSILKGIRRVVWRKKNPDLVKPELPWF